MDTAAKHLVSDLLSYGIDTYFGVPGGPVSPLFDAVLRTENAKLVESRHETAALFEAIGYYKSTGKIPVVLVSAGPGITNSLTGLASAKALRVPLILISGDVAWERDDQILLQTGGPDGVDIERTFAAHTEKVLRFRDPTRVSSQALGFLFSREGNAPSIFVIPLHVSNAKVSYVEQRARVVSKPRCSCPDDVIDRVCRAINEAQRPLLVIGYGARNSANAIERLIDVLNVPYVTTPQGKGILSEDHALSLRNCGLGASQWIREYVKTPPDTVLVLGTDLDDCSIGTTKLGDSKTTIIHVDTNPKVFNRRYATTLGIVSDVESFAWKLAQRFEGERSLFDHSLIDEVKSIPAFDEASFKTDDSVPIAPHRALADLQSAAPVRFVTDIGEHMLFCLHYLTIHGNNMFSIDLGLGSMGSGICQAIGMTIGDRKQTIIVCGDGGMQMHGMEMLTAIREELPIIFVVFNDARYNMVYHGFSFLFGRKENLGETDYVDFAMIAQALGVKGVRIDEPGQINKELLDSLWATGKPAVLDVRINKDIRIKGAGRNEALKHMGEFDNG